MGVIRNLHTERETRGKFSKTGDLASALLSRHNVLIGYIS